jgi:hypothetical protein
VRGRGRAYLGRSGQSLFDDRELRIALCVDGPEVLIGGTDARIKRTAVVLLLWWRALGPGIAWAKASLGLEAKWIGAHLELVGTQLIKAEIPDRYIDELGGENAQLLRLRVIPLKRLQRHTGKAAWAAELAPVVGSFASCFWNAMSEWQRLFDIKQEALPRHVERRQRWSPQKNRIGPMVPTCR